ncbi:MAG: class I SAM-dependent methyltransferase, partial [Planctomycetes bacterium]|nr:class I SAM-dependent methyltransferase [Planctomycetota bacterium]
MTAPGEPDIARFAGVPPGARVLDCAAGRGRAAASLVAAGARVVVLDRREGALGGIDPDLRPRVLPVAGDAYLLPFRDGTFDAVVLRAVLHHLEEPARALREAARVLRPGGPVVVVDKAAPEDTPARALRNAVERIRHSGHVWAHSPRELRALAGAARLAVEESGEWVEEKEASAWIAGGTCAPPWDGIVMEYLRADLASGGRALGTAAGAGGGL